MSAGGGKADDAYRTIGEVSRETGVPQHVLRYWETRFPTLRPVTRAGGRRYYRPEDVALVARIKSLLGERGHTMRGVQMLLEGDAPGIAAVTPVPTGVDLAAVRQVRDSLAAALADD